MTRARPLLGTFVEITAGGLPQRDAQEAVDQAFRAVAQVHALMSYQSPDSEVSRVNRLAGETPVAVSEHTWRVLQAAQVMAQFSGGLFDITIAPTLSQLGFLPRHAGCPRADARGSWRDVQLLGERRVNFTRKVRIDLSGIAKGYAVDLATRTLQGCGVTTGRVNAGGDLRVFGPHSQRIYLRHPGDPGQTLPVLELQEGAVATSASYFACRMRKGRSVTPLIHPGQRDALARDDSVTVIAAECMTADALTKVVHADAGRSLTVLEHFKADALLLRADQERGAISIHDLHAQGQDVFAVAA